MSTEDDSGEASIEIFVLDSDEKIRLDLVGRLEGLGHNVRYVSEMADLKKRANETAGCMIGHSLALVGGEIDFPFDVVGHPPANNAIGMAISIVHDPIGICEGGGIVFLSSPFSDTELNEAVVNLVNADQTFRNVAKVKHQRREVIRQLPEREAEVMQMIFDGMMNKNIARRLNVSLRTVETDRANLFEKFDADSAVSLVRMLSEIGYGGCVAEDACPIDQGEQPNQ